MNLISILLVDDHELVRSGIARLIADQPDMKVIGEVSSGEEALQFIFHSLPAIIIMDAGMPGIGVGRRGPRAHPETGGESLIF